MPSTHQPHRLHRSLPSTLYAYHELVQEILCALDEHGWSKEDLFGVHMALEESISNAVRHGNKEDPAKQVHVDCEITQQRFWAKVCDEGPGYDPKQVPDCCSKQNLKAAGGRGLKLIRAYMTSVKHSDCGRCLEMEKVLP